MQQEQTMKSQISLKGLVATVMLFAVGVLLHEATRAAYYRPISTGTASPSNESPVANT
jgi:hypothetical protein